MHRPAPPIPDSNTVLHKDDPPMPAYLHNTSNISQYNVTASSEPTTQEEIPPIYTSAPKSNATPFNHNMVALKDLYKRAESDDEEVFSTTKVKNIFLCM